MIKLENGRIIIPNDKVSFNNAEEVQKNFNYDKKKDAYTALPNPEKVSMVKKLFDVHIEVPSGRFEPYEYAPYFKLAPWEHQRDALKASNMEKSFAYFMEQGTGKSKCIIDEAVIMEKVTKSIDKVVIICPKSLMATWEKEISTHVHPDQYRCFRWGKKGWGGNETKTALDFHIYNIDAVNTKKGYESLILLVGQSTFMAVDESTTIKNIKAQRTQKTLQIAKQAGVRRILTGTPITKNPLDLYSQMMFLDPWFWGGKSYWAFRNQYAVMGGYDMKEVVGFKNQKQLTNLLDGSSFRVTKEECLDLPSKIYSNREVGLTPQQKKAYLSKVKEIGTLGVSKKTGKEYNKTMVVINQLHQITGGNLKDTNEQFPCDKIKEVLSIIEEGSGKTLIWCKYVQEIKRLKAVLEDNKIKTGTFYGGVHLKEREANVIAFNEEDMQVLILQYQSGGMGLTLNAASTVIFYSNDYSYANRIQAEDRCHRGGQTKSVTYIDLICPRTIDIKILGVLKNKKNLSDDVMEGLTKRGEEYLDEILW
jgi:SNF2 family DNA or RNA helicase